MADSHAGVPELPADAARSEPAEVREARLKAIQMDDLGISRRNRITTADNFDFEGLQRRLGSGAVEASRKHNQAGTQESKAAQKDQKKLSGWNTAFQDLQDDGCADKGLEDEAEGQLHRLRQRAERLLAQGPILNEKSTNQPHHPIPVDLGHRLPHRFRRNSAISGRSKSLSSRRIVAPEGSQKTAKEVADKNDVRDTQRRRLANQEVRLASPDTFMAVATSTWDGSTTTSRKATPPVSLALPNAMPEQGVTTTETPVIVKLPPAPSSSVEQPGLRQLLGYGYESPTPSPGPVAAVERSQSSEEAKGAGSLVKGKGPVCYTPTGNQLMRWENESGTASDPKQGSSLVGVDANTPGDGGAALPTKTTTDEETVPAPSPSTIGGKSNGSYVADLLGLEIPMDPTPILIPTTSLNNPNFHGLVGSVGEIKHEGQLSLEQISEQFRLFWPLLEGRMRPEWMFRFKLLQEELDFHLQQSASLKSDISENMSEVPFNQPASAEFSQPKAVHSHTMRPRTPKPASAATTEIAADNSTKFSEPNVRLHSRGISNSSTRHHSHNLADHHRQSSISSISSSIHNTARSEPATATISPPTGRPERVRSSGGEQAVTSFQSLMTTRYPPTGPNKINETGFFRAVNRQVQRDDRRPVMKPSVNANAAPPISPVASSTTETRHTKEDFTPLAAYILNPRPPAGPNRLNEIGLFKPQNFSRQNEKPDKTKATANVTPRGAH